MSSEKTLILNKAQTLQKITRIAYEIYENNPKEKEIYLAGIYDKGYQFAEILKVELEKVAPFRVVLIRIDLDKFTPQQGDVQLDIEVNKLKNKTIILLDDVLNTGRTVAYSLKPFLNITIKRLQTAVIVDRAHKNFPISADYVGYSLSTSLKENIEIILDDDKTFGVYIQ
jgi:pyrimidine operon attenuation protein/uracil phosphoribosyltransferase